MTKEEALNVEEKAIDKAFERGKELSINKVNYTLPSTNELNKELDEYRNDNGEKALSDWMNGYDFLLSHITKTIK